MSVRVLVPSGVLGLGFDSNALEKGLARKPDIICIDGGSTDSGPHYLGTGTSKYARSVCQSELRQLMIARAKHKIPLVIGTCGTCGANSTVDWLSAIVEELLEELGQSARLCKIYTEPDQELLINRLMQNEITPLEPLILLDEDRIKKCSHIVALAGAEAIQQAINEQADIILAGRTTDTAIISALPLMRGMHAGAAWHGAKIAECGALCSTNPTSGVILLEVDESGFSVEPMADGAKVNPHTVSAHMLYENSNPYILYEPGGYLDVRRAHYQQLENGTVRVEGSEWHPTNPYTVKLEGAYPVGYQTVCLSMMRDPYYTQNAQSWGEKLTHHMQDLIRENMKLNPEDYQLEFRFMGQNAVLGDLETEKSPTHEVGILSIITAASQAFANEIAQLLNPHILHFPLSKDEELPSFTFPLSPPQMEKGVQYAFGLNHILALKDPLEVFTFNYLDIEHGQDIGHD